MMVRICILLVVLACLVSGAGEVRAQNTQRDLRNSQLKLDSIQAERQRLQREMETLRTRVRDASRELLNVERQRETSRSALLELDFQRQLLTETVETTARDHMAAQDRLRQRTDDMHQRIRSIYKRGRLSTVQVVLAARSFGELLNRYKYMNLVARYDRAVVQDFVRLEREMAQHERDMREALHRLELLQDEKSSELDELERVERQRQSTLRQYRQQETRTAGRLTELEREQQRVASAIAELERRRREEEARSATPAQPGSITTRDLGRLAWPVEGNVVYRFGPDRKANGIVLRNQGIGIGAPAGTEVRSVESGVVEFAGPFPGYGPSVIVSHGGGYRTLYLYLKTIQVQVGQQLQSGEVLGTVGGEQTAEGAHIEFQVRVPLDGGIEPVDPLSWLRGRSGGD